MDLIDPAKLRMPIAIVGAGSIGSWTVLALAKMGCSNLTVYENDIVEPQNIGCQLYGPAFKGGQKKVALFQIIYLLTNLKIKWQGFWDKSLKWIEDFKIIISAIDSIETRKELFENLKGTPKILMDGRMAGNAIEIFVVRLDNEEDCQKYEKTFFPEEQARPIPCSRSGVVYNCLVMAGVIADLVSKIAKNEACPGEINVDLKNIFLFKS